MSPSHSHSPPLPPSPPPPHSFSPPPSPLLFASYDDVSRHLVYLPATEVRVSYHRGAMINITHSGEASRWLPGSDQYGRTPADVTAAASASPKVCASQEGESKTNGVSLLVSAACPVLARAGVQKGNLNTNRHIKWSRPLGVTGTPSDCRSPEYHRVYSAHSLLSGDARHRVRLQSFAPNGVQQHSNALTQQQQHEHTKNQQHTHALEAASSTAATDADATVTTSVTTASSAAISLSSTATDTTSTTITARPSTLTADTLAAMPFAPMLGLTDEHQVDAFLQLYGYWAEHGGLIIYDPTHTPLITFQTVTASKAEWMADVLPLLPLQSHEHETRQEGTSDQQVVISKVEWVAFFLAQHHTEYTHGCANMQ